MTDKTSSAAPRILVTMGEPAGIGPELIVRAAQSNFAGQLVALANQELLVATARKLKLPLKIETHHWSDDSEVHRPGRIFVENVELPETVNTGKLSSTNAPATLNMLSTASELALSGKVDAIVTGPVHKANLNLADPNFLGHTEFFAEAASCEQVVMMLATRDLRISLATTHLPLSKVSESITQPLLTKVLQTILNAFDTFGLAKPRVAVCGLNPHAGENGLLGHEDDSVVKPVIDHLAAEGHLVTGPYPADTLFTPQKRAQFDVFLAMYHDQGLPVVKAFGFGQCANITLGLPYIRTSVDHGTALDIASAYSASSESLEFAINYAIELASGKLPS